MPGWGKPKTTSGPGRNGWPAYCRTDLPKTNAEQCGMRWHFWTGSPNPIQQQHIKGVTMEIGFHFVNFDVQGGAQALPTTLAAAAQAAEQAGASWFTMADHFFQMDNLWPAESPMLEVYTSLGYLAGQTERIKLVVLVNGVMYRYPGLLAKTVTTLDVLSRGRAVFGLGAAWYEREHIGLGVPSPPTAERFERLEETLQICKQMWSPNNGRYDSKHYHL